MAEAKLIATSDKLTTRVVGVQVYVREPTSYSDWKRFLDVMNEGEYASSQRSKGYATDYDSMEYRAHHGPVDEEAIDWRSEQETKADRQLFDYRFPHDDYS